MLQSEPCYPVRILPDLFLKMHGVVQLTFLALVLISGPSLAQPVINEIMQNPAAVSDSNGEWFELHNPTGSDIDIDGWTIQDNDFDSHLINNGGPLLVPAGGYLVLGRDANSGANGGVAVDYQYSTLFLGNSGDELVLLDGSLTEVDRVEWDGGPVFPDPNGASMSLSDPALDNNDGANWCTASTPFGSGDLGTPGAANDCAPVVPELVINEIMQNPAAVSDSNGEWFELYNPTGSDIDIDGWTIQDNDFDSHLINNGGPLLVPAGGYLVLGNNDDSGTNGGVTVGYGYSSFFLSNSSDELVLIDTLANEVDRVEWDDGATFPDPNGASMALSNPALDNNVGANWCTAGTPFGDGDSGTPGSANDCPVADTGLVINEIDYDQPGTDRGEFIEILNTGGDAIDLDGHSIVLVNGNGGAVYDTIVLPAVSLAAGDYFVICGDSTETHNCDLDVSPDSNLVQNGSPDAVALFEGATLLDTVSYEGDTVAPFTEGSGSGLGDSSSTSFVGISRTPDGSDTNVNNVDFSLRCVTPGAANTLDNTDCPDPRPPALKINEIDYDQPSSDTAEFVEIYNAGSSAADLSGIDLVLVNGSGGGAAIYNTIALPAVSLPAGDFFVVCATAANVANCDFEGFGSVQNGGPDAVALQRGSELIDTVSYEGDTGAPYTEGSGSGLTDSGSTGQDNRGISRFPNGTDTGQNNVDLINACITPGTGNTSLTENCSGGGPVLEIFQIQGDGAASPYASQGVATNDNVVTAVGPEGFFMQTPTVRADADADTSNGIYVFTGGAPGVEVGDLVDVSGQVVEFFGFTEFTAGPSVSVDDTDQDLPAAVPFGALIPSPDPSAPSCAIEFECYEGMLVSIADGTVTGGNQDFGSDPLAEIYITAAGSRTFREPGIEFPGLGGSIPTWDGNPEVFELDPDKLGLSNQVIPGGSSFAASGILGFEFGDYELWPTDLSFTPAALPLAVRARLPGEFTVGSLNLLRLFDSDSDYANRLSKFSAYINDVLGAPDVLGIQEAGSITELQDLAAQIVADYPAVSYTAHLQEGNDVGGIDVGFLVRNNVSVDTVTQLGAAELFTYDEPDSLLHDRPPLLLRGHYVGNGAPFPIAVMVVHIRSLNGIETERVQQKRLAQAQSIATMAQDFQSGDPLTPLIVIGDFNAFEFTDGYVDVLGQIRGDVNPAENVLSGPDLVSPDLANQLDFSASGERYSFVFEGNAQVLDHALTSSAAGTFARDLQFGRGNADAAHDQINDPGVLRSSDHDGLVLYLMSDFDGDGVADDLDECPIDPSKTVSRTGGDCTTAIPTLGPSGLLILLVVTGGWGAAVIRRRRAALDRR